MTDTNKGESATPYFSKNKTPQDLDSANPIRVTSEQLLAGRRELFIEHGGDSYRLRVTNKGKLILTK